MNTDDLLIGTVVNTHGIRGDIKVQFFADSADIFDTIDTVRLDPQGKRYEVEGYRVHKGSVLLKLSGVDDIDTAAKLVRQNIYVSREQAPLPKGRFFIVDLIGLSVITDEGAEVGKLTDVFRTGSNDVFTVKSPEGKEILIPVIDEVVTEISPEKGHVLIHPMKGLLSDED